MCICKKKKNRNEKTRKKTLFCVIHVQTRCYLDNTQKAMWVVIAKIRLDNNLRVTWSVECDWIVLATVVRSPSSAFLWWAKQWIPPSQRRLFIRSSRCALAVLTSFHPLKTTSCVTLLKKADPSGPVPRLISCYSQGEIDSMYRWLTARF